MIFIVRGRALFLGVVLMTSLLSVLPSCEPIVAEPISDAPKNSCASNPCAGYEAGAKVRATCTNDRCEIPGRPDFQFFIVVHVPDTSIFAAGTTFVLKSDVFTKTPDPASRSTCTPPTCLLLPSSRALTGYYTVTAQASRDVGYPLNEGTSIPIRAEYFPIAPPNSTCSEDPTSTSSCLADAYPSLPLDKTFMSSSIFVGSKPPIQFSRPVPPGRYARVLYPQPPFDQFFPPTFAGSLTDIGTTAPLIDAVEYIDSFELGNAKTPLDDPTKREVTVTRDDGLAGFRVWLADQATGRRISTIKTLSGKTAKVRLDTSGESSPIGGGLRDDVDAIVAPPDSYIAVPRYQTALFSGAGLQIDYPSIPPPAAVIGVVAAPPSSPPSSSTPETLLGYPASISFESELLVGIDHNPALLHYATRVTTDDRGRFQTLLPPGTYRAVVEPAEGTGFAKDGSQVVTIGNGPTTLTLRPPSRTSVTGRVLLTDERPLADADVIAFPDESAASASNAPVPRPGRTKTGSDGRFELELDPTPPGFSYAITVIPKAGSGFPWVVTRRAIQPPDPQKPASLPDVRVPAPTRLSFRLRDPGSTTNPIVRAVVRIFAAPASNPSGKPLEIGTAMTDPNGFVEILLAQQPP